MGDSLKALEFPDQFVPIKLTAGNGFVCALSMNHSIVCWGANSVYQLGDGTNENRGDDPYEMGNNLTAVYFGSTFTPIDVEAGGFHVCAMSVDRQMKCWGRYLSLCEVCALVLLHIVY